MSIYQYNSSYNANGININVMAINNGNNQQLINNVINIKL